MEKQVTTRFKPYSFVRVQQDGYSYIGEVLSFETPEHTLMVRRVPGHPGTLEEMPVSKLSHTDRRPKYVHYASVAGRGSFPVDMLRYEFAAPVNFLLIENEAGIQTMIDHSFGIDELLVATATDTHHQRAWTPERWSSFLWGLREIKTERLERAS